MTQIIKVDSSGTRFGVKKIYCRATNTYGTQSDTVRITFKAFGPGIGEQNSLISKMSVYPNPATADFSVGFSATRSEPVSLELMSFDGRIVWQLQTTTRPGINTIHVPDVNVSKGLYLVRMKTEQGDLGQKLIIK